MTRYSYSKLGTYEKCPRKFKYKYIDDLDVEGFESIEPFMGSRVHDALEKLYKAKKFTKIIPLPKLLEFYRKEWERNWHDNIKIVKDFKPEHYKKLGERCIRDYYNSHKPFDRGKIIGNELKVNLVLDGYDGENYNITGKIDRLVKVGDKYEVHDYKTSHSLPKTEELRDNIQLALYAIAVKRSYENIEDIGLVWHYLIQNEEIELECSDAKIERVKEKVKKKIKKVEEAKEEGEFPTQKSGLCPYCGYQEVCPLFKHKFETEDLEPKEFKKEEGVKLVNKFRDLREKKKEAERKMKEVKKKLVQYSKQKDVQYVYGSDVKANVKTYKNPYFPRSNDPKRDKLVEILREEGKLDELSTLKLRKLSSKFKNEEFDQELIDKLENFVEIKENSRIYLSKDN